MRWGGRVEDRYLFLEPVELALMRGYGSEPMEVRLLTSSRYNSVFPVNAISQFVQGDVAYAAWAGRHVGPSPC